MLSREGLRRRRRRRCRCRRSCRRWRSLLPLFYQQRSFSKHFLEKTGILFASKHFEHTHLQVLKQREREWWRERESEISWAEEELLHHSQLNKKYVSSWAVENYSLQRGRTIFGRKRDKRQRDKNKNNSGRNNKSLNEPGKLFDMWTQFFDNQGQIANEELFTLKTTFFVFLGPSLIKML